MKKRDLSNDTKISKFFKCYQTWEKVDDEVINMMDVNNISFIYESEENSD